MSAYEAAVEPLPIDIQHLVVNQAGLGACALFSMGTLDEFAPAVRPLFSSEPRWRQVNEMTWEAACGAGRVIIVNDLVRPAYSQVGVDFDLSVEWGRHFREWRVWQMAHVTEQVTPLVGEAQVRHSTRLELVPLGVAAVL